jgi:hypothetical protein
MSTVVAQQDSISRNSFGIKLINPKFTMLNLPLLKAPAPYTLSRIFLGNFPRIGIQFKYAHQLNKNWSFSTGLTYLYSSLFFYITNNDLNLTTYNTPSLHRVEFPFQIERRFHLNTNFNLIAYGGYAFILNSNPSQINVININEAETGYIDQMYFRKSRRTGHSAFIGFELESKFKRMGSIRYGWGANLSFFSLLSLNMYYNDPYPSTRLYYRKYTNFNSNSNSFSLDASYFSMNLTYMLPPRKVH